MSPDTVITTKDIAHRDVRIPAGTTVSCILTYDTHVASKGALVRYEGHEIPLMPGDWRAK